MDTQTILRKAAEERIKHAKAVSDKLKAEAKQKEDDKKRAENARRLNAETRERNAKTKERASKKRTHKAKHISAHVATKDVGRALFGPKTRAHRKVKW